MVGFDDGVEQDHRLDSNHVVPQINADLSSRPVVTIASALEENAGVCFLGMMKAGPFDLDADIAKTMLAAPLNPNGRPNSDVVKRRMGGQDITGRVAGWMDY